MRYMSSYEVDEENLGNFFYGLAQVTSYGVTALILRYGLRLLSLGRDLLVNLTTLVGLFWSATAIEDW